MKKFNNIVMGFALVFSVGAGMPTYADRYGDYKINKFKKTSIQLGDRPFYLVEGMDDSRLKRQLQQCEKGPFYKTEFSIAHRGAPVQFPEHSDIAYKAGARQGAGIVECDVAFTNDGALVCRHSECDLHTTTNIVETPLNQMCTVPWTGPVNEGYPAPRCCTSDLNLSQYKSLEAKMDASNPNGKTAKEYLGGTASWRSDWYAGRANVLTFEESIRLNQEMGVGHTPELKGAAFQDRVEAIFGSQEAYAQAFADELDMNDVKPWDAWVQSFNVDDVFYWIDNTRYGKQAVYLLDYNANNDDIIIQSPYDEMDRNDYFRMLKKRGVKIIAPPIPALLNVENGKIVPSELAKDLKRMRFDIITWSFERSDVREGAANAGYYFDFDPNGEVVKKDSDMYIALDALARKVGVIGIFSDWPATVTYYANCMGLK